MSFLTRRSTTLRSLRRTDPPPLRVLCSPSTDIPDNRRCSACARVTRRLLIEPSRPPPAPRESLADHIERSAKPRTCTRWPGSGTSSHWRRAPPPHTGRATRRRPADVRHVDGHDGRAQSGQFREHVIHRRCDIWVHVVGGIATANPTRRPAIPRPSSARTGGTGSGSDVGS